MPRRSPQQRHRRKQAVSLIHSRPPEGPDCTPELLAPARLEGYVPSPAVFRPSSAASSLSCSRCSSQSSLASAAESEDLPPKTQFTCALHDRLRPSSSVCASDHSRYCGGEYCIPDDSSHSAQCVTSGLWHPQPPHTVNGGGQREEREIDCRRHTFLTSRHRVQPEVDHGAHRKSLWLGTPTLSGASADWHAPSGDRLCGRRRLSRGQGEGARDLVCDTNRFQLPTSERTCDSPDEIERGPNLGPVRCDPERRVFESHKLHRRSVDSTFSLDKLDSQAPECTRCQRPLLDKDGSPHSRGCHLLSPPSSSLDLSPPTVQTEARVVGTWHGPCCSRLRRVLSRMLRMRYVGRCLLLLLLTGLGGLFAHVTVLENRHGGGDGLSGFGEGMQIAQGYNGILPSNMLMNMDMRPVPLQEFHAQLRHARSKFDLLRIFLANKDVTDASLTRLYTQRHLAAEDKVLTHDGKKREMTSEEDDAEFAGDDEEGEAALAEYYDGEMRGEGFMADEFHEKSAESDALMEELEEVWYHMSEMDSHPLSQCKHPQPEIVSVEDPKGLNRMLHPSCTVIHRCRSESGCCGQNAVCAPKRETVVFKSFLVVDLNPVTQMVLPDKHMVERISFVNHTECECRQKPKLPDCTRKCPGVFRMYRHGVHCVCDCQSPPNEIFQQCDSVKDGIMPLDHQDLVCIKSGECGVPKCSVGEFSVSTGYCPIKDFHTLPSHVLRARLRDEFTGGSAHSGKSATERPKEERRAVPSAVQRARLRHQRRNYVTEGSGDF